MINIKSQYIESIYLLSVEEALKLPKHILAIGEYWWLRSPGTWSDNAPLVNADGSIYFFGDVVRYSAGVRPALKIKNLDSTILELGEIVEVLGLMAQYIGNDSVLFCESIAKNKFDNQSSNYETSEVKRFIEEWLKERKSEEKPEITREEAVEILTDLYCAYTFIDEWGKEKRDAIKMGAEALKREQQLLDAGYQNTTVDFYIGGRLFRAKEIAQ